MGVGARLGGSEGRGCFSSIPPFDVACSIPGGEGSHVQEAGGGPGLGSILETLLGWPSLTSRPTAQIQPAPLGHTLRQEAQPLAAPCLLPAADMALLTSLLHTTLQDVSGGRPVEVSGTNGRVWGMEIDTELARQELRELSGEPYPYVLFQLSDGASLQPLFPAQASVVSNFCSS